MKIGLLGGTFDPIHQGHLDVARSARSALSLDEVWFLPARMPPHRHKPAASAAHRFAMTALATAGDPGFRLSDLEMDRSGPSYTIDTLESLPATAPPATETFFIIGADAFREVPSWRAFPEVLDRSHFVVVSRPGFPASALTVALPTLASRMRQTPCEIPTAPAVFLVDADTSPVSSTDVRRRLSSGQPLDGLVPDAVKRYISRHALYVNQESDRA